MEANLQQIEKVHQEPLSAMQTHSGNFLQFRADPSPIIKELTRAFCGKEWDSAKKQWSQIHSYRPLANDDFMNRVMPILAAYVNPNSIHGNLNEQEAHRISENATTELIFLIGLEYEKFQIAEENFDIIVNTFDDLIFLTLTRAISDGERNHEDASFRTIENMKGSQATMTSPSKGIRMFGGG